MTLTTAFSLLLCTFGAFAVQNEVDLQLSYTSAITAAQAQPRTESGSPIDYEFAIGRATNYAYVLTASRGRSSDLCLNVDVMFRYNQYGACGFGDINEDESLVWLICVQLVY